MKRLSLAGSVIVLSFFTACKEIGPAINFTDTKPVVGDTTYVVSPVPAAQVRNVLLEEFTGVSCPNCPQAHERIESLKADYGDRLVAVGLYKQNLNFTDPLPSTDDDFRIEIANMIDGEIYGGAASQLPIGGIDRIKFNGAMLLDRALWPSKVQERLNMDAPVNLDVATTYSDADSTVTVKIIATFTQNVSKKVYFSAAITQDSIIDAQEDSRVPGGEIEDYEHNHVLRAYIAANNANGIELKADGSYEPGRVFERTITGKLKSLWKPEHCRIIVFLHYSGSDRDVLQVKEVHVK